MSSTQLKHPLCQVPNTGRAGKARSLAPLPGSGTAGLVQLRTSIPAALGTPRGHRGLGAARGDQQLRALGTSLSQAAAVQESPSCAQQSTLVPLAVAEPRPCRAPIASRCPALSSPPRWGGRGLLLGQAHVMLAGMPKFSFSEQKGGAPCLGADV